MFVWFSFVLFAINICSVNTYMVIVLFYHNFIVLCYKELFTVLDSPS